MQTSAPEAVSDPVKLELQQNDLVRIQRCHYVKHYEHVSNLPAPDAASKVAVVKHRVTG